MEDFLVEFVEFLTLLEAFLCRFLTGQITKYCDYGTLSRRVLRVLRVLGSFCFRLDCLQF